MLQWIGQIPSKAVKAALDAWLDLVYVAPTAEGKLKLYVNNYTPGPGSGPGDFTQASFGGYSAIDLPDTEKPTVRLDTEGNAYGIDPILRVFSVSGVSAEVAYGLYITDDAGTTLLGAARFDTPVAFDVDGKAVEIELAYRFGIDGSVIGIDATASA